MVTWKARVVSQASLCSSGLATASSTRSRAASTAVALRVPFRPHVVLITARDVHK